MSLKIHFRFIFPSTTRFMDEFLLLTIFN